MNDKFKPNPGQFAEYLQSVVKLDALDKMTQDLDKELTDSQNTMMEIKAIYDTVSAVQNNRPEPVNSVLRHEDISKFLGADVPNMLMADMTDDNIDVDIEDVIATLKVYAEDLKKNFTMTDHRTPKATEFTQLELDQYAKSMNKLSKCVSKIKINKREELKNRSVELEDKLTQLCEDVYNISAMMQAKTALTEIIGYTQINSFNAIRYDTHIGKLLSGINEVTYLLQNKNRARDNGANF